MSHIGECGDVPECNESILSLGTSLNTAELLNCNEGVDLNNGEKQSHNFNPSIVPNSAISLTHQNSRQNTNDFDDEVICLDDHENEQIISGRQDGGGFIVNGSVQFDDATINSDCLLYTSDAADE